MRDRDPLHLYPPFRAQLLRAHQSFNAAHPADPVGLFEGLRSFQRQGELYAIGRSVNGEPCVHNGITRPLGSCALHPLGKRVTNAPAGMSWHNYGLGADTVFDSDPVKPDLQATWDGRKPWNELGASLKAQGLEWAGDWRRFPEFPHAQNTFGMQLTEALAIHQEEGLQGVWAALG